MRAGFVSLVYPLIAGGIVSADYPFVAYSVTGYSGGGKKMIAEYESKERSVALDSPRQYGLGQTHKHLPEMQAVCGLAAPPVFSPIVSDYYSGMCVTVPLISRLLTKKYSVFAGESIFFQSTTRRRICCMFRIWKNRYTYSALAGRDDMRIFVGGNDERILLCSVFDNLGKGASGAAVQCMNILLGLDERTSLAL